MVATEGLPSAEDLDTVEMEKQMANSCYFCFEPSVGQRTIKIGDSTRLVKVCRVHQEVWK